MPRCLAGTYVLVRLNSFELNHFKWTVNGNVSGRCLQKFTYGQFKMAICIKMTFLSCLSNVKPFSMSFTIMFDMVQLLVEILTLCQLYI